MKKYDVIVIGSGSGGEIVNSALNHGFSVAWIDKGPLGGTCLNVGCIPSKMLIYPADRIVDIQESEKLGIKAEIKEIDFSKIMKHMKKPIKESHEHMEKGLKEPIKNFDYYKGVGHFISDYTIEINNQQITGKKVFIGSGARPLIPKIKGIEQIDYLTNENVFNLSDKPESLIIIGGGYIAVEFAHFFAAMGAKVTILQRADGLIKNSEPEISDLLKKLMEKRLKIIVNIDVTEVKKEGKSISVFGLDNNGKEHKFTGEKILIATGRKSNADLLKVENTGVEVDKRGYIIVNEFLETSKKNIWAFGDAIGKYMFKHVANEEAVLAWHNSHGKNKRPMDYSAVPYAVFTYPQIAGVGLTEKEAKLNHEILVGMAKYSDVAKGEAMAEINGFAKAIVDKKNGKILGFHIIGPEASILIQEVVNAMALGGKIGFIGQGMHIHPALPELILRTFSNLRENV
jgi:mycothione reductase